MVRFASIKSWLLLMGLLLSACGNPSTPDFVAQIKESHTSANESVWTLSQAGATGPRILLIHGLTVDHTFWYHGEQAWLVNRLWKANYQIMFIDLPLTTEPVPYTKLKSALNGTYAQDFYDHVTRTLLKGDEIWNPRNEIEIGGVSWGGLHTLMACAHLPQCTKYFVIIPVPKIEALHGFENSGLDNFNPFNELASLQTKRGYVTYGGADQALDAQVTTNLANSLTATTAYYPIYSHQLTFRMVNNLADFFMSH